MPTKKTLYLLEQFKSSVTLPFRIRNGGVGLDEKGASPMDEKADLQMRKQR